MFFLKSEKNVKYVFSNTGRHRLAAAEAVASLHLGGWSHSTYSLSPETDSDQTM